MVRRDEAPFLSGCESRPATVVCGRLPDCQAFLSRLVLHLLAFEVVHENGVARQSLARAPVERGPAFRLALKGFPHGRPRQSPAGPQRSGGAAQRLDSRG